MKTTTKLLIAGFSAMTLGLNATLLVSESFDYDPGAVAGLNGGEGWSNAWGAAGGSHPVIVSGNITAPTGYGFTPSGNSVENTGNGFVTRGFASTPESRLFLDADNDNTYYMSWLSSTTVIGDVNRLNLVDNTFGNIISIGKLSNANDNLSIQLSGQAAQYSTTSLTGGDFLIVAKLQSLAGELTVSTSAFASTGSVGAEPVTWDISVTSSEAVHVKNMLSMNNLMQGASGNIGFDEFQVGTTYASVIPEPSTLALLGIALGSVVLFRRRKI